MFGFGAPVRQSVFHYQTFIQAEVFSFQYLLSSDFQTRGADLVERFEHPLRPLRTVRFQRVHDRLHSLVREYRIYLLRKRRHGELHATQVVRVLREHDSRVPDVLDQLGPEIVHLGTVHEMRGDAGLDDVAALQPASGQAQHDAQVPVEPGQHVTAAHVAEQPDGRFRHGEQRPLSGHPVLTVHGYSDAAAHRDAVDQRHVRDFVLADRAVHRVLVSEEVGAQIERRGAHPLLGDRLYVATRAERLAAGALDDHHSHLRFVFLQFWPDLGHHR